MLKRTVKPRFASALSVSITFWAVLESRPLVGSSRKSTVGLVINSYPIEVLFLSPDETPGER